MEISTDPAVSELLESADGYRRLYLMFTCGTDLSYHICCRFLYKNGQTLIPPTEFELADVVYLLLTVCSKCRGAQNCRVYVNYGTLRVSVVT